ncbi:glycosyltransferase family 4 protein [Vibrio crassostreae]|uniref:glycosyltransferase family 4 protein n=1 Tax=Vibrio crassostreae TaxID=246167 RepID=UPI001053EF40|nr:glycosyltransferase family 1 protein [Vibrio crassostreae]TCW16975.1 alpha-1,3-rhamnosyl/mannosyltransferase [Vibrio crassostreae]CAK3665007.1 mannosyl-N-acetyl-alpha-D-glucosaminyl-diphospho-ditrans,octacis-undecaprenol 3-alpha-mannosyltransferase / alpha-1,3-rhamnosyltransferase [Vibrio crassostreae]
MQNKLLINVSPIREPLTGIGYYTLNILSELLSRDVDVIGIRNGKLLPPELLVELVSQFQNPMSNAKSLSSKKRLVVEFLRAIPGVYQLKNHLLSLRAQKQLKDLANQEYVYFEPSFVPFDYEGVTITTVHDLSFLSHPSFHPATRVSYLTNKMQSSITKSDHIVVDSDFILKELHDFFPASKEKSSTLYLGVADSFRPYAKDECDGLLRSLKIKHNHFVLSVATLEPRKNLSKLIDAYKLLPSSVRNQYPLVLVGDQGWKNIELMNNAKELVERGQIIFTGYLADDDLKHLYASAAAFVYPSLYEGFGLPVIEAMASGSPVITSNIGATAEVAASGALLVNPCDEVAISKAILRLIQCPGDKANLSKCGIDRASTFKWPHTVEQLLEIASVTSRSS